MALLLSISLGMLPALLWLWLIQRKDDHEPEPDGHVVIAFGLGLLSAQAVLWVRPYLEAAVGPVGPLAEAFLVTAFPEEWIKLAAFLPMWFTRELDEPLDGVVYGAAVGLGFAAVENVFFLAVSDCPTLVCQRAFTATLAHACFTGGLGFCFAQAKLDRPRLPWMLGGLALAVLLHGLYDWFLEGEGFALVALLLVLPLALSVFALKMRWARKCSPRFHPERWAGRPLARAAGGPRPPTTVAARERAEQPRS